MTKRFWILLLFAAFAARIVAAFYWNDRVFRATAAESTAKAASEIATPKPSADAVDRDGPFFFGDSDSYWKLGRALASGRSYRFDAERNWTVFRTPGYPALLAPFFWFFGENPPILAARLQGVAFGTANVALIGLLAFGVARRRDVAALSGLFAAFDPTLVLQSVLVLSEESFLTFALLQNVVALKIARELGLLPDANGATFRASSTISRGRLTLWAALLGETSAAAVYLRPSWYWFLTFSTIFVVLFRCWAAFCESKTRSRSEIAFRFLPTRRAVGAFARVAFVSTFVFFLALSPWIVRNYRVAGRFVPTSLQMGASLYDGLNPNATGASDMRFVDEFRRLEAAANPAETSGGRFEVRLDERLKNAALDWTRTNPGVAVRLAFVKLARLWSPIPREPAFASTPLKILLAATFAPIFVGGLCGFFRSLRRREAAWALLLPALYVSALHSIFVSSIRYRVPILYGFWILTALFAVEKIERILNRVRARRCEVRRKAPIIPIIGTRGSDAGKNS